MRLWHYKLIPVLPNAMLVSQWRECIAIKRQWEKGTLKHRLVSYVKNYDRRYFRNYILNLMNQMYARHINFKQKYIDELLGFTNINNIDNLEQYALKYPEHNDRYLKQCYYNLQEKYDRCIITKEEWEKIENLIGGKI